MTSTQSRRASRPRFGPDRVPPEDVRASDQIPADTAACCRRPVRRHGHRGPAAAGAGPDPRGVDPASPNPLAGLSFYVDHNSPAWGAWETYTRRGQKKKAGLVWKIAREPRSIWLERPPGRIPGSRLAAHDAAKAAGRSPSSSYDAPRPTAALPPTRAGARRATEPPGSWNDALARGIGGDRGDRFRAGLARNDQLPGPQSPRDRYRLLRHGVDVLSQLPNATVLPGGRGVRLGVRAQNGQAAPDDRDCEVRGFMLNASHFDWTAANIHTGSNLPPHRRQALRRQHGGERSRSGALPARRPADQRLVQPRPPWAGTAAYHRHIEPCGGRLSRLSDPASRKPARGGGSGGTRRGHSATRAWPPTGRSPREARASATSSATLAAPSGSRR